jgi:lipase
MTGTVLPTTQYGRPDGPPVVALHGLGGTKERWERTATEGVPLRRWICPDLRGHGASVKLPPWTLEQLAHDVVVTLDSLQLEGADLVGASLGGAVAFAVARIAPSRARSVVVVDAAASTPEEYLGRRLPEALYEAETIDRFLEPRISLLAADTRDWARREIMAGVERTTSGGFRLRATPEVIAALRKSTSENLPPTLGQFAGHVLLLESGLSHNVTEAGTAALRSELGARFHAVTFDDAGHNLLWDVFDETVSEIERFLNDVDQDRRTSLESASDVSRSPL